MRKKAKINKKGFTLIELLIVIAIIGILASVILVSLNFARGDANAAKALVSLESAAKLAEICLVRGGNINDPAGMPTANPGNRICDLASITENWPDLTGTNVLYRFFDSWPATSAFGIRTSELSGGVHIRQIVCAANRDGTSWFGGTTGHPNVSYDFRGVSASCRKYGF